MAECVAGCRPMPSPSNTVSATRSWGAGTLDRRPESGRQSLRGAGGQSGMTWRCWIPAAMAAIPWWTGPSARRPARAAGPGEKLVRQTNENGACGPCCFVCSASLSQRDVDPHQAVIRTDALGDAELGSYTRWQPGSKLAGCRTRREATAFRLAEGSTWSSCRPLLLVMRSGVGRLLLRLH